MKEPLNRTKIVIRHLPPTLSHSSFFDQIDVRFSSSYNWSSFRPGKSSYKKQRHARAYINFIRPEDVFEFAEFFGGHVFVNEKGTQYKAIVEYAPSQRVPKSASKKDGREGTIFKDPEYVEFLERVSKPAENLPSADIQLERREAERAGVHESPIVTPLMDFVRKRRAAKSGNQAGGRTRSPGKSRSSKHVAEKKKYIFKASGKSANGKDKSTYVHVSQRENQLDTVNKKAAVENEDGSISNDTTKKKILLLKGKEQDMSQSKAFATATEVSPTLASKFNQRNDASGKIIRSILLNKESRQAQPSSAVLTEQKFQSPNAEKSKRPPRSSVSRATGQISINEDYVAKKSVEDKSSVIEAHGFGAGRDRQDRRTRSRERLDRVKRGDPKHDSALSDRYTEMAASLGSRNSSYGENGSHRYIGRRGPGKDDITSKRGGVVSHGPQEKQVWVQKSASGS